MYLNSFRIDDKARECLTTVSKAFYKDSGSLNYYYELNNNTHANPEDSVDLYKNYSYGVYKIQLDISSSKPTNGYIIFNIDENYPIAIDNIDISNVIKINENYIYTKTINSTNINIEASTSPENKYKNYNYYYGALQIEVDDLVLVKIY